MKKCKKCKAVKEEAEFNKASHYKCGLHSSCRACCKEYVTRYYSTSLKGRLRYSDETKEIAREHRRKRLYGVKLGEYSRMFKEQSGACAICKKGALVLYIDHDHETKKVRELLCRTCNFALGYLKESPGLALAALNYLVKHGKQYD